MTIKTVHIEGLGEFSWPAEDTACFDHVSKHWHDAKLPLKYMNETRVCIQAGGNMGVWPRFYSRLFEEVFTFESDPYIFQFLQDNVKHLDNATPFCSALSDDDQLYKSVTPKGEENNLGARQAHTTENPQDDAVLGTVIDDMNIANVDLIQLDIEGMELKALKGAEKTIKLYKPVLHLENKGLSDAYGTSKQDLVDYVQSLGYRIVESVRRDIIAVHESKL